MQLTRLRNDRGLGLIELTVIIVVIGILAVTAMRSMEGTIDDIKQAKTEREMEMLADAIVGDAEIGNGSSRTDFGYVGDVGAFPPNLDALLSNPGGYSTWDGPYIEPGIAEDNTGFKTDEWGTAYSYTGGITITSTGSGSTISKKIADATSDYLLNSYGATVKDSWDSLPGSIYADSIDIVISVPNGSGGTTSKTYNPDSTGTFTLDSLPAGTHPLRIIYKPNVDTLFRYLTILPRHKSGTGVYNFASNYFGGGGGGGGSFVETLRPMGAGTETNLLDSNCTGNWSCVDEVTSDGDGTFVKGFGSNWNADLYAVQDHTAGSGTIDSVTVYVRAKGESGGKKARTHIKTNGSTYDGAQNNTTAIYEDYSTTYITNPQTSSAWTWTEIDALEIGVDLKKEAFCTQVWVEVYYTN